MAKKRKQLREERQKRALSQFTSEEQKLLEGAKHLSLVDSYSMCGYSLSHPLVQKELRCLTQGLATDVFTKHHEVLSKYYEYIRLNKLYPKSEEDLLNGNLLDVSKWWDYENTKLQQPNDEFVNFTNQLASTKTLDELFCFYVPPFSEGTYKLDEFNAYVHYVVGDVFPEHHVIEIHAEFYNKPDDYEEAWNLHHACTYGLQIELNTREDGERVVETSVAYLPETVVDPSHIAMQPEFRQTLSKFELKLFDTMFVDKYKQAQKILNKSIITVSCMKLVSLIAATNCALYHYSPKVERKPRKSKDTATPSEPSTKPTRTRTRRVRTIDTLKITSVKVPHVVTTQTIRNYKVASWQVRGGVRRLKSGKLVPFRPSVHHRRSLVGTTSDIQPSKSRII